MLCGLLLCANFAAADEPQQPPLGLSASYLWTADGDVMVFATVLSQQPVTVLTNARMHVTGSAGVAARSLTPEATEGLGQFVTAQPSGDALAPPEGVPLQFTGRHGMQVSGLYHVPADHPSTITLTVQADSHDGPVQAAATLAIDPQATRSSILVISPLTEELQNASFPVRSQVVR